MIANDIEFRQRPSVVVIAVVVAQPDEDARDRARMEKFFVNDASFKSQTRTERERTFRRTSPLIHRDRAATCKRDLSCAFLSRVSAAMSRSITILRTVWRKGAHG